MRECCKMEVRQEHDDLSPLPYRGLLEQFSEAIQNVYLGSPTSDVRPPGSGHRRTQSEVITGGLRQNNSFHKWRSQMQKAWRWGSNLREPSFRSSFNPEVLANQKRQWYRLHSKTQDHKKYEEPTSLFENFIIAGLPSDVNLEVVEEAFVKRKKWELEMAKSDIVDLKRIQKLEPVVPILKPQILFKFPPGKKLPMRLKDLAAFCFPGGVKAHLLERTPSLSDLNELVYGQEHLSRDDLSFIFSLKVADNATLYGVCLHVREIVQRPPGILGGSSPFSQSPRGSISRFLVSAPRCYCILTRVPFFELHYEMLNSIIAQERLNRITEFINEFSLTDSVSSVYKLHDQMNENIDSPNRESLCDWMATAIPLESAVALTAAAAGIMLDDEVQPSPSRTWELQSPESITGSEASDYIQLRDIDKDDRKKVEYFDDNASEVSDIHSDSLERTNPSYEAGQTSPEYGTNLHIRNNAFDHLASHEFSFSPARSTGSEDNDDEIFLSCDKDYGNDMIMEWARENKNDLLQIVCHYYVLSLPSPGSEIVFQPLEHLQAIEYRRPQISALGLNQKYLEVILQDSQELAEVKAKFSAAEEALALSVWTTAAICRALSLDSVLALLAGALLEKQVVVVCPNLGVLSASVLSIIPMIRPFEWQCLYLPVLPGKMLDFLDAPVPFIVGTQHKPTDARMKTSNLVYINVLRDEVKMCYLPALPRHKELLADLRPIHSRLQCENAAAKNHPVYKCSEVQAEAAAEFLAVMRSYMESLCSDLRSHTITNVQSNNDRVSLLLKDSFVDSFSSKDKPFVKLFVETQMFSVLSDFRLSIYEHGYP